jgi:antitoxin component YwqK of YwqJK toxin-antitoxin module
MTIFLIGCQSTRLYSFNKEFGSFEISKTGCNLHDIKFFNRPSSYPQSFNQTIIALDSNKAVVDVTSASCNSSGTCSSSQFSNLGGCENIPLLNVMAANFDTPVREILAKNLGKSQPATPATPATKVAAVPVNSGTSCKTDSDCSKKEFCWSVDDSDKKECQARLPSNQADEQTAKNTNQKEITTNVIWKKDGIAYLPNETKPFTGKYEEFNSNGEKKYVTIYDDGKSKKGIYWDETGEHEFEHSVEKYYKTSMVIEEKNGVFCLPNTNKPYTGVLEEYYPSGNIEKKIKYVNGKEAEQHGWYENGQKSGEVFWENPEHGEMQKQWHENGKQAAIGLSYKDGRSIRTLFNKNGNKTQEMNYKNGKNNGLHTSWYENGKKSLEVNYKDDEEDGIETFWDENGQKGAETRYKNGKKNGVETFWDEGRKIKELVWKNDELIEDRLGTSRAKLKNKLCEIDSNFAESIMKFRQNGEPMSKIMKINQDVTQSKANRESAGELIIAAYEKPRFTSEGMKQKSIEDFRDKAYLDCVKAAR